MEKVIKALEIFRDFHDTSMTSEEFVKKYQSFDFLDNKGLYNLANETLIGIKGGAWGNIDKPLPPTENNKE